MNILTATSIVLDNHSGPLTTNSATIMCAAASNTSVKVISLFIANVDGTNDADISLWDGTYHLAKNIVVPAKSTLVFATKDSPIVLEASQFLKGYASANNDIEFFISWEIIS